jgi:LacI family transcriptional regulator
MPNIIDVALRAHVSIATVSRVVNKSHHKVNRATQERVLEAIRELDYHPNALAKGLLMKRTMTIGIIIPDISNPYYAEIVRGIQDVADQAGYAVTLHNTDKKPGGIARYIYLLREKSADGIIFSGGIIDGRETVSILKELRERVVVKSIPPRSWSTTSAAPPSPFSICSISATGGSVSSAARTDLLRPWTVLWDIKIP